MDIRGVRIDDTFAEAFGMRGVRIIITAKNQKWARESANKLTGFATSVIACKCEAAIERELAPGETPDGRPGISVLLFTMDSDSLPKRVIERIGQTVLTCPTTACFDGLPDFPDRIAIGKPLRTFGDGFQGSKMIDGQRYWRLPVMEGEFLIQETFGKAKGVGGGNFLILAESADAALDAAEAAVDAMAGMPGVILPFPGGIVRSGSKVGALTSHSLPATTNHQLAPTLRAMVPDSLVPEGASSVFEIVIDGVSAEAVRECMRRGLHAAAAAGASHLSAANFGGKLGEFHFPLSELRDPP
jgi:formylmethanofuran--tetrahydromethanopterin N-formyltransferase